MSDGGAARPSANLGPPGDAASGSATAEGPPVGKEPLFERATRALREIAKPAFLLWVPGRIEFLGKHTDYAGGRSLVCPADRGFALAVAPRTDDQLAVHDARTAETAGCRLNRSAPLPAGHWSAYPATVARRVARNFSGARGADLAFASDLPPAAGMSSSSALVVGTFLALSAVNALPEQPAYRAAIRSPEDLAGYLGTIENGESFPGGDRGDDGNRSDGGNRGDGDDRDDGTAALPGDRGVGTFGGSEDHTAMICGRPGALVQYAYAPVRFERAVPLPEDHVFVVADSGVVAEKTGAARERYNSLSAMAAALLRLWRADTGRDEATLAAAIASSPAAADRLRDIVAATVAQSAAAGFEPAPDTFTGAALSARLEHFLLESGELVPAAGDALARMDLPALGRIVDRSQAGAERLLGNQVPETVWLARRARELGAVAASAFGAGFGGSVWALAHTGAATELLGRWRDDYARAFPRRAARARFFISGAGRPAGVVPASAT